MELKDFIRESLVEIAEGIRGANEAYKASANTQENAFHLWPSLGKEGGEKGIHFDVAVTSKEEVGAKGGISVLGLGAECRRYFGPPAIICISRAERWRLERACERANRDKNPWGFLGDGTKRAKQGAQQVVHLLSPLLG